MTQASDGLLQHPVAAAKRYYDQLTKHAVWSIAIANRSESV
jgi:hypothetical protein